jgi:hypothetical protein
MMGNITLAKIEETEYLREQLSPKGQVTPAGLPGGVHGEKTNKQVFLGC